MRKLKSILFLLISIPSYSQVIDTTKAIDVIQIDYKYITANKDSFKSSSWDVVSNAGFEGYDDEGNEIWVEDGSPYETISIYVDSISGLSLLVVKGGQYEGYETFYKKEFYLRDTTIFFYYQESGCIWCPDFDNDQSQRLTRIEENRCYFQDGKKIRHLYKSYAEMKGQSLEEVSISTSNKDMTNKSDYLYPNPNSLINEYIMYINRN